MSPINVDIVSSELVSYMLKIVLKSITSKYVRGGKDREIIHRDLKPENILFSDPEAKSAVVFIDGLNEAVEKLSTDKYSALLAAIFTTTTAAKVLISTRGNEPNREHRQTFPNSSIVGIYRKQKFQEVANALVYLLFFLVLIIIASFLFSFDATVTIISLLIPIVLLFTRQLLTDYRIAKGFFITNEHEARELISFIISESLNIDFTDRGKLKKILSDDDLEEIRGMIPRPAPGSAD
jgi:serine/threonine protein kinase